MFIYKGISYIKQVHIIMKVYKILIFATGNRIKTLKLCKFRRTNLFIFFHFTNAPITVLKCDII